MTDLGQVFQGGVTAGPGFVFSVRPTSFLQGGLGGYQGYQWGWQEGRLATIREESSEFGAGPLHYYVYRREADGEMLDVHHPRWADPGYREYPMSIAMQTDRRWWDLGATFHLFLLGIDFDFRLDELADFATGLFGYDLLQDDIHSVPLEELQQRARSSDAAVRARAFDALLQRGEPTYGYAIYTNPRVRPSFQRRAIEAVANE